MAAGDPDQQSFQPTYQAATGNNIIVSATPAFLHSIIVGEDQAGGVIKVSDHASDGDGNIVLYIDNPVVGTILVDEAFEVGITVDMPTQTHVTFIWR